MYTTHASRLFSSTVGMYALILFLVVLRVWPLQASCSRYCPPSPSSSCSCAGNANSTSDGYCETCFQQPTCKNVSYVVVPANAVFVNSPLYIHVVPRTPYTSRLNNICYTYFLIDQVSQQYLLFVSEVKNDGTSRVQILIAQGSGKPGKLRFEGFHVGTNEKNVAETTIVGTDVVLGTVCNSISAIYRCYEFAKCNSEWRGVDVRYGGTNTTDVSLECKQKVIDLANDPKYNFNTRKFVILPNSRPWQCITRFREAQCIGADKVKPVNSRAFP